MYSLIDMPKKHRGAPSSTALKPKKTSKKKVKKTGRITPGAGK